MMSFTSVSSFWIANSLSATATANADERTSRREAPTFGRVLPLLEVHLKLFELEVGVLRGLGVQLRLLLEGVFEVQNQLAKHRERGFFGVLWVSQAAH